MKTDREMLDEAMGLLRHARPVFDSSAAVADWWDENAELWKAYLARGCSTPEPPTPEPFVTRQELAEAIADLRYLLHDSAIKDTVWRELVQRRIDRLRLGKDARGVRGEV